MARTGEHYTHGHHESVLRSHSWRTVENSAAYLEPHLVPGTSVLDVGSGPGTITVDIAAGADPEQAEAVLAQRRSELALAPRGSSQPSLRQLPLPRR